MQEQSSIPFRPLEYWKPPKAFRHIRAKSSAIYSPGPTPARIVFTQEGETGREREMSYGERAGRGNENPFSDNMQMATSPGASPPAYVTDKPETLEPRWYDFKRWGWKRWAILGAGVVAIIVIVVVAVVEVEKANRYPDYSKLSYSLEDTCESFLLHLSAVMNYVLIPCRFWDELFR